MALLASVAYDPSTAASLSTASLLAMTVADTANLRVTFTAPSNGIVLVRLAANTTGSSTPPRIFLGVLDGATVRGRGLPIGSSPNITSTDLMGQEAVFLVTGLTPSTSYTWDAAY